MLKNLENYRLLPFVQIMPVMVLISALVIATGVFVALKNNKEIGHPLFLGIDFTGGSYIALKLAEPGNSKEIKEIAKKYSIGEPVVQLRGADPREVEIRVNIDTREAKNEEQASELRVEKYAKMKEELAEKYGGKEKKIEELSFEFVGPIVGAELIKNAIYSLAIGSIAIMFYIFIRFNRFVFAIAAVIALLHDVLVTLTGTAIMRLEVNAFFIAVILTIIGYSINDTIIIYDRIRENLKNFPQLNFPTIINLSLTQTLTRSVNTVLTVIFVLIALLVLGGRSIYDFSMAMLWGMVSGMYSSIFIAAPLILWFTRQPRGLKIPSRLNILLAQEQAILGEWEEEVGAPAPRKEVLPQRPAEQPVKASEEVSVAATETVEEKKVPAPSASSPKTSVKKLKKKARRR